MNPTDISKAGRPSAQVHCMSCWHDGGNAGGRVWATTEATPTAEFERLSLGYDRGNADGRVWATTEATLTAEFELRPRRRRRLSLSYYRGTAEFELRPRRRQWLSLNYDRGDADGWVWATTEATPTAEFELRPRRRRRRSLSYYRGDVDGWVWTTTEATPTAGFGLLPMRRRWLSLIYDRGTAEFELRPRRRRRLSLSITSMQCWHLNALCSLAGGCKWIHTHTALPASHHRHLLTIHALASHRPGLQVFSECYVCVWIKKQKPIVAGIARSLVWLLVVIVNVDIKQQLRLSLSGNESQLHT